ncbi:MAG: hypothetical protein EA339_06890 [Rhodobacteraceae bacterium]|nr:MAG: hypothetical protein EA339_06890 [Paracoccaceae bacterium]
MITDDKPGNGPTPEKMVSYSETLLNLSIARLTKLLHGYGDVSPADSKELSEEFRSLRKALEIAYHERANLQKLKGSDSAGGAALDLDAARDEIYRRLDRLRIARGGDGVSR